METNEYRRIYRRLLFTDPFFVTALLCLLLGGEILLLHARAFDSWALMGGAYLAASIILAILGMRGDRIRRRIARERESRDIKR